MRFDLSALPHDIVLLQRMVREAVDCMGKEQAALADANALIKQQALIIEKLNLQVSRFTRGRFGSSSEQQDAEQLRLIFEEAAMAEPDQANDNPAPPADGSPADDEPRRRGRKPLPAHLPRRDIAHMPEAGCHGGGDGCSGPLVKIGEDVTEILEYIPARFEVIRHVRPRLACRQCEAVHQAPAPSLPIPKARAGAALLAHILVSRFQDHLPYYRQAAIFARHGIDLDRNVMIEWAGKIAWLLQPIVDRMSRHLFSSAKIHGDDTPIDVLAPGNGKTKTGRLWVYLRHDRRSGDNSPPVVVYRYSADRRAAHPEAHLNGYRGYFQADAFPGYSQLYRNGVKEVGCWAHVRRHFNDIHVATKGKSPIAAEALIRIGELYAIERNIQGQPVEERLAVRQRDAVPKLIQLKVWFEEQLVKLAPKSTTAVAIGYATRRWPAMTRYCEDGRLEIDNNLVENALRGVSLGRKNWLFAGSDKGGERAALFYSLIETCKLHGLNAETYLTDVIGRIADHPINRIDELLPWEWAKWQSPQSEQKAA